MRKNPSNFDSLSRLRPREITGRSDLRLEWVAFCIIAAVFFYPVSMATAACSACDRFAAFGAGERSAMFDELMAGLEKKPAAIVAVGAGRFCESGQGASVADALRTASENQFTRADAIARAVGQCPRPCAAEQRSAEYCAYGGRLIADRYGLAVIGLRTSELVELYGQAEGEIADPLSALAAEVERYGNEALAVLQRAHRVLSDHGIAAFPDVRWQAGEAEINRLSGIVSLLADLGLMRGDAKALQQALATAATGFRTIRQDPLFLPDGAKNAAHVDLRDRQERILLAASELAFVMASLDASLTDRNEATANRQTVSTARDPDALRKTIGCLNRLTLSALRGSEAAERTARTLDACRSFDSCGDHAAVSLPANLSSLNAFLRSRPKAELEAQVFLDTLCSAE